MIHEHEKNEMKPSLSIPFEVLPEGKHWDVGQTYRVKLVLRQTNKSEQAAMFEIIDATSLEADDKARRKFMYSTDGLLKG